MIKLRRRPSGQYRDEEEDAGYNGVLGWDGTVKKARDTRPLMSCHYYDEATYLEDDHYIRCTSTRVQRILRRFPGSAILCSTRSFYPEVLLSLCSVVSSSVPPPPTRLQLQLICEMKII